MNMMKAVRIHYAGGPEVLHYEDAPRPEPSAGEVLIHVHAASVNPADWKVRAGFQATRQPITFPHILGWDVAGTVESVGSDVTTLHPGDPVYGLIRFPQPGSAYAQYATAPIDDIAPKPVRLDYSQAAALPLVALTAWQALFEVAHLQKGQTAIIHGATGGVGHIAVQLAKAQGATVIAIASAANTDFVRALGADHVVDYHTADLEHCATDVDVVFDTVGGPNAPRLAPTMKAGATYISIAWSLPSPEQIAHSNITAQGLLVHPDGKTLVELAGPIDKGLLTPIIEEVFPLAQTQQAHRLGEAGHVRGKLVLDTLA
jgi:NADPH:quinone reductase-like Zn-dependent oxidoreductase